MYLSELAWRLCTQDLHSLVIENKKKLDWTLKYAMVLDSAEDAGEVVSSRTLKAIWKYIERFRRMPAGPRSVRDYIVTNPDSAKEYSRGGEGGNDVTRMLEQLEQLESWVPPSASVREMDAIVLMESAYSEMNKAWHLYLGKRYGLIASGMDSHKWREFGVEKEDRGPAAAARWLRMQWLRAFTDDAPSVDGFLDENVQVVREKFADLMDDQATTRRVKIGIEHIDKVVPVGEPDLTFVGIFGMSGQGKTTLLNYIVYKLLTQGTNGLYWSIEHSPETIWSAMTYLHSAHPDYEGMILPPKKQWALKNTNDGDIKLMMAITEDIMNRRNLPGRLEVKRFQAQDLDSIEDWLTIHHARNKYDFLVIDRIDSLKTHGDHRFQDKEIEAMIHRVRDLTRNFDNNRGLLVLSPIQITKQAFDESLKKEVKEGEAHIGQTSIRQHTAFINDCDVLLSVWSTTEMRDANEIEVGCGKNREGRQPPAVKMVLSPRTGRFSLHPDDGYVDESRSLAPGVKKAIDEIRNLDSGMVDQMPSY